MTKMQPFVIRSFTPAIVLLIVVLHSMTVPVIPLLAQSTSGGYMAEGSRPYTYSGDYNRNKLSNEADEMDAILDDGIASWISLEYAEKVFICVIDDMATVDQGAADWDRLMGLSAEIYGRLIYEIQTRDATAEGDSIIVAYIIAYVNDLVLAANHVPNANVFAPLARCAIRRGQSRGILNPKTSYPSSVSAILDLEYPNFYGTSHLVTAVWQDQKIGRIGADTLRADTLKELCIHHAETALDTLSSACSKSIASYLLGRRLSRFDKHRAWTLLKESIELTELCLPDTMQFYGGTFTRNMYIDATISYLPDYFPFLCEEKRPLQIVTVGDYLLDLGDLDRHQQERVAREVIRWTETSLRYSDVQDDRAVYKRLQRFYQIYDPKIEL